MDFDLYTILSITHRLPVEGGPYQAILKHMTGLQLSPLQSGRARDVCAAWLLEQHPRLAEVPERPVFKEGDYAAMDAWADEQRALLGATSLPVAPLPPGEYTAKPIVEEVLDLGVPPEKIFVVDPDRLRGM